MDRFRGGETSVDETLIQGLKCVDIAPGRGLVMEFVPGAPPKGEMKEGKEFPIAVKFANYNEEPITASFLIKDTTGYDGFADQTGGVTVDGATYQENISPDGSIKKKLVGPGCFVFEEQYPQLDFGFISYTNLPTDEKLRYIGKIDYDYTSFVYGDICVFDPAYGSSHCQQTQTLSEGELGPHASGDPVTVTKVVKTLRSLLHQGGDMC